MLRALLVALVLTSVSSAAVAYAADDCNQTADPALRIEGCTEVLRTVGTTPRDRSAALTNRANAYHATGDLPRALRDHEAAAGITPTALAYSNVAAMRHLTGDEAGALAALDKALELDPGFADAYHNRAVIKVQAGDLQGGLADLDAALEADPNVRGSLQARIRIRCALGMGEAATADILRALEEGLVPVGPLEQGLITRGFLEGPATGQVRPGFEEALLRQAQADCRG